MSVSTLAMFLLWHSTSTNEMSTFLFEMAGHRWATDLGADSYGLSGYWSKSSAHGNRYSYCTCSHLLLHAPVLYTSACTYCTCACSLAGKASPHAAPRPQEHPRPQHADGKMVMLSRFACCPSRLPKKYHYFSSMAQTSSRAGARRMIPPSVRSLHSTARRRTL